MQTQVAIAPQDVSRRPSGVATRVLRYTGTAIVSVLVLALLVVLVGTLAGYKPLTVLSGSMSPTLMTGDMVITKEVSPREVAVGEIVTFSDPKHQGRLITHRVTGKEATIEGYAFTTRGDANSASEQWTIKDDGKLGQFQTNLPGFGNAAHWFATPLAQLILVAGAGLGLMLLILRKIWTA